MARMDKMPKPMSRRTSYRSLKSRAVFDDKFAQVTKSIVVVAGENAPEVETKVIPVERIVNGQKSKRYEVRVEYEGGNWTRKY